MEVHGQPFHIHPGPDEGLQQGAHVPGCANANRVTQAQLVTPEVEQLEPSVDDLLYGDLALPRVTEAHGQVTPHAHRLGLRRLHYRPEHLGGLGASSVETTCANTIANDDSAASWNASPTVAHASPHT